MPYMTLPHPSHPLEHHGASFQHTTMRAMNKSKGSHKAGSAAPLARLVAAHLRSSPGLPQQQAALRAAGDQTSCQSRAPRALPARS